MCSPLLISALSRLDSTLRPSASCGGALPNGLVGGAVFSEKIVKVVLEETQAINYSSSKIVSAPLEKPYQTSP